MTNPITIEDVVSNGVIWCFAKDPEFRAMMEANYRASIESYADAKVAEAKKLWEAKQERIATARFAGLLNTGGEK